MELGLGGLCSGPSCRTCFRPCRRSPDDGGLSGKKIVLDPGHGSSDSGATQKTANGTLLVEKEQNLIVANKLKDLLEASGATVYMTRTTDKALSNTQRYEYANSTGADVLVSLHMNGSKDPTVDYTNVLYGKWYKDRDLANAVFDQLTTFRRLLARGLSLRGRLTSTPRGSCSRATCPRSWRRASSSRTPMRASCCPMAPGSGSNR